MKLRFSVFPPVLEQRGAEIAALITTEISGAAVFIDEQAGLLYVVLSGGLDVAAVTEAVCAALARIGVSAQPVSAPTRALPPIRMEEERPRRRISVPVFVTSLIAVALVAVLLTVFISGSLTPALSGLGFGFNDSTLGTGDQDGEDYAGKIALVDRIFEQYSLYDTDGELLLDEMLKAYAAATGDTYAAYYTEEEYQAMVADNNAKIVGIGVTAIEDAEHHDILVIDVLPDSPALAAGLQSGDRIIAIGAGEGKVAVAEIGYEAAVNRLRGEAGTAVAFTVWRNGVEIPFTVTRAVVTTLSVTGRVSETDPTVGHVRITQFDTATPTQFKSVMTDLIGKGCTKFVFDVRNNPGGDLKSIIAVLSCFLQEGDTILSTVKKDGTTDYYRVAAVSYTGDYEGCSVKAEEIGMYRGYPMAVLANGGTASAAELFTAALKDYQLAAVIGKTTYGKGVLQNIYHLESWGYTGAVKLTVGYYSPPSGVNYDGVGILPDAEVALRDEVTHVNLSLLPEADDDQLLAAVQYLATK